MSQYNQARSDARPSIRIGTIVWGGILLLVSVFAATLTFFDPSALTAEFYLWSIIVFGGVLVLAGVVGAVVRASMGRKDTPEPKYVATSENSDDTDVQDLFGR